jgi:predicted DNA-binding transcriptional regulator AlpA
MTMSNPTLTAEAAAKILGLATSTLAKLRLTGNGPVYCKLGRRVVYRREDLEAWLQSRVVRNTSDADARVPKSLTGERAEKTNGHQKSKRDAAASGPKQASPRSTTNTDVRLSKGAVGNGSTTRAAATGKSAPRTPEIGD